MPSLLMMKPPDEEIFLKSLSSLNLYHLLTNTVRETGVPLIVSGQGESTPEQELQLRSKLNQSIKSIKINVLYRLKVMPANYRIRNLFLLLTHNKVLWSFPSGLTVVF